MKLEMTKETAMAIMKLNKRYFFDLFTLIRASDDEEYEFRNAIEEIANSIKEQGVENAQK